MASCSTNTGSVVFGGKTRRPPTRTCAQSGVLGGALDMNNPADAVSPGAIVTTEPSVSRVAGSPICSPFSPVT